MASGHVNPAARRAPARCAHTRRASPPASAAGAAPGSLPVSSPLRSSSCLGLSPLAGGHPVGVGGNCLSLVSRATFCPLSRTFCPLPSMRGDILSASWFPWISNDPSGATFCPTPPAPSGPAATSLMAALSRARSSRGVRTVVMRSVSTSYTTVRYPLRFHSPVSGFN
ncbi:hypothetical protein BPSOL_1608 [Bifidobacterium pseudolongum]|nr:hypothetical protein BPSOL_1608 [Bifidobacterium pseudolongum]